MSHASLLRASGQTRTSGTEIDVRIATGTSEDPDGGVPDGAVLRRFARAIVACAADELDAARAACLERLGESRTIQAASIVASFDGINRVADAAGIQLDPEIRGGFGEEIIETLELEALGAARG